MSKADQTSDQPRIRIQVQVTPNPRARKLIVNRIVKAGSNVVYATADPAPEGAGPMIEALLATANLTHIYLSENIITVTQDGSGDWDTMCAQLRKKICATMYTRKLIMPPPPERPPRSPERAFLTMAETT